jgi:transcriptional regulator with XRE-family HTH domain
MFKINERIKQLRINGGLTQKQLAETIKVSTVTIQRFEYGTVRPSLDTLVLLADFFAVSLDYLVGRTNDRN